MIWAKKLRLCNYEATISGHAPYEAMPEIDDRAVFAIPNLLIGS